MLEITGPPGHGLEIKRDPGFVGGRGLEAEGRENGTDLPADLFRVHTPAH
jgi:hypothetical protein